MLSAGKTVTCRAALCASGPRLPGMCRLDAQPKRSVRCNFREGTGTGKQRGVTGQSSTSYGKPRPVSSPYAGYSDDPLESLKQGWTNLQQSWNDWDPEDRNRTLAYGAGSVLALYIANSLLNSIESLPIFPGLLKLIGFGFTTWFFFRYVLYADGRQDLARDFTVDNIFGQPDARSGRGTTTDRITTDRVDDLARSATASSSYRGNSTAASGGGGGDGGNKRDDEGRFYSAEQLDSSISGALKELDNLAQDPGSAAS